MQIDGVLELSTFLKDCALNEPKQLLITVTPTANSKEGGFKGSVSELGHYDDEDDTTGDEEDHPPKPKGKSSDSIIAVGLGGSKKSKPY